MAIFPTLIINGARHKHNQHDTTSVTALTINQVISQAEIHRQELKFPFIAITGSNGKTTTKGMLSRILQRQGRVYDFSPNSDIAVKIAQELLTLSDLYDWALVKMGAATPDEIRVAARLVRPRVGIITNVGEAHLERHGSIEKIAAAKEELVKSLCIGDIAVLNRDNEFTRKMGESICANVVYFGLSPVADYYASDIEHLGPDGTVFDIHKRKGRGLRLHLPIYSHGDIYNALAAYAAASEMGLEHASIKQALETDFELPNGRGRLYAINGLRIIDDTYDATPQSLYKSSKSLVDFRYYSKRLILVMGEMSELGEQTMNMHAMMGHYLSAMPIDVIVLVGQTAAVTADAFAARKNPRQKVLKTPSPQTAVDWFKQNAQQGDTIMIEGSKSADMSVMVRELVAYWRCECYPLI